MKTFREILNKMKENNLPAWRAMIATEVDCYGSKSDEDFEIICSWCYEYMIDSDETDVSKIVSRIINGLNSGGITIENLKNNDIACDNFVENYDY